MAKPKCSLCGKKKAKRYCPSLDQLICPVCCGTNRLRNISCQEDCRYLDHEEYQQETRKQKELNAILNEPVFEFKDGRIKEYDELLKDLNKSDLDL